MGVVKDDMSLSQQGASGNVKCPNLTSLTALFKGSDVTANIRRSFTGALEQVWPDALPVTASDSYGYQRVLNPGVLSESLLLEPLSHAGYSRNKWENVPVSHGATG